MKLGLKLDPLALYPAGYLDWWFCVFTPGTATTLPPPGPEVLYDPPVPKDVTGNGEP